MSSIKLIINADDYARSEGVNRGIMEAHQRGVVSTTTAMMNLPDAQNAIAKAHARCPELGFGVHLNITFGKPLCAPAAINSLLSDKGTFHTFRELLADPNSINISEVEQEWRRQIQHFLATGIPLDHLDSHHHVAVIRPDIFAILLDLAAEFGCGVRNPNPADRKALDLSSLFTEDVIQFVVEEVDSVLNQRSVQHPDFFLASFFGTGATIEHLTDMIDQASAGTSELMCHPGFVDADLREGSSYTAMRERELQILTNPEIKSLLQRQKIELHSYRSAGLN